MPLSKGNLPQNGLLGYSPETNENSLIMYSKDKNESRDWLNLSSNKLKFFKGNPESFSKRSNDSTPLKELSEASYINVVTPANTKKESRFRGKNLGSENHNERTSLSELLDSKFPPKPPRIILNKSRESSVENSVDGFFGRFSLLSKYKSLIKKLSLPKIHEHFRPKTWNFGKKFFNIFSRQDFICNRINP